MKKYLTLFSFKHAFSVSLSVLLAVIIGYYFSFSHVYWVFLTTFLVSQTTRGTPLRQGLFFFLIIIFAIFISFVLDINIKQPFVLDFLLAIIFIICGYVSYIERPQTNKTFFLWIYFPLLLLIATLSPEHNSSFIRGRIIDVLIGAAIGMIICKIIFPVRLDKEFSAGVISLLRALAQYSQALTDSFLQNGNESNKVAERKIQIEQILQGQQALYPEWAYEVGFNPGLRSGYRFFLVNLERITEVFFSMDYLISRYADLILLEGVTEHITHVMQKNQELLSILIDYFENKKLKDTQSDFTSDTDELEKAINRVLPANLELLGLSDSFVILTAFVRDIRDMRGTLLQLVMALPERLYLGAT